MGFPQRSWWSALRFERVIASGEVYCPHSSRAGWRNTALHSERGEERAGHIRGVVLHSSRVLERKQDERDERAQVPPNKGTRPLCISRLSCERAPISRSMCPAAVRC